MLAKAVYGTIAALIVPVLLIAQCGLDPISGLNTISTAAQIPNSYYPGQGNPIVNALSVTVGTIDGRGSGTVLATGDLVLIMQMQGADINSGNGDAYGNGVAGGTASGYLSSNLFAGNYEYNTVASVSGATVNLSFSLANNYYTRTFPSGAKQTFQVIRVPRYYDLTISAAGSVIAPAWDGNTGGVVVLDAANVLTIDGTINLSGLGFRGGGGIQLTGATAGNTNGTGALTNTDYRWNSPVTTAANLTGGAKGEGIAGTSVYLLTTGNTTITTNAAEGYIDGAMGRGAPANAGGGATDGAPVGASTQNQYNTGGGGGANAGAGGQGGSGWHGGSGNVNTYPTGGYGGTAFTERSILRFIMGGGAGAGSANNSTGVTQYMSSGGAGGGIILLRANSYAGSGTLNANGADAIGVTGAGGNTDAAGGGGAGGTIVAVTRTNVTVGLSAVTASASGGKGGNMETYFDHGPGGGGGGGFIVSNGSFASTTITGGATGLTRTGSTSGPIDNVYGATAGSAGQLLTLGFAPVLKNANNAASPCGTLPVKLNSFTALLNNTAVALDWKVTHAIEFSHFEIEYSNDGLSFSNIGRTSFASSQSRYQFTHSPVAATNNFYRLKLVNLDGSYKFSNILFVNITTASKGLTLYPQPAREYVTVNVSALHTQRITLRLFNSTGVQVKEEQVQLNNGNSSFIIDKLQAFPRGIYILKATIDGKTVSKKIMIGAN
ncbi:MAG: T9SS type A sorting domain-containing protein [Chitinophagaceae bacterium]|nr:T9SS type A sorting domain-containing protein [Chitinophagaceae bacterium]